MITYPLALPSDPKPSRFQLRLEHVVALHRSPFTSQSQTQEFPGEHWLAELAFDPMERFEAEEWIAVLLALRGLSGSFLLPAYGTASPRGSGLGSPVVDGAGQSGQVLLTRGWTANQSGLLLPGDFFQLGSGATARLHKALLAVNSDGLGKAAIDLSPRLREAPADGAPLTLSNPRGLFRLASNLSQWDIDAAVFYGIGFSAVEAI